MVSLKNRSKGFTIVELLIVIVVIAILATLVIVTFTGIQQRARDSQRQTDINAVNSHLAAFFADKGYYPSFAQLNTPDWIKDNMQGLDPEALVGPRGGTLSNTTTDNDHYEYVATEGSGAGATACGDDDQACDTFTLTAKLENGNTDYTRKSN